MAGLLTPHTRNLQQADASVRGRRRLPGLRAHLLALVLAVLLPALAVAGAAAWSLAESYRRSFEARLGDTAQALSLFMDSELRTHLAAVTSLASSPLLERDDLASFNTWAREVGKSVGGWVVVNEAAPGHQQLLNTALPAGAQMPPPSPAGEGAWNVIRRAVETQQATVSDFFVGRASNRPLVAVAAPAWQQGQVTRVVVLALDPTQLADRLRAMGSSGGAFVSVADSQGRIVARSRDQEQFLGTVPPSRHVPDAERARGVFRAKSVYGEDALFAARELQAAPGWTVAVAQPYASYRASWLGPLATLAGGGAIVLALGLVVAAALARRILRPVEVLVRRAEAVAADGDRRKPLPQAASRASIAEFEMLREASQLAEATLAASEAEFRAMFRTAAAGVAVVDGLTRRYLRVNQSFCDIVGRTEVDLISRLGPDDVAHPADHGRSPSAAALEQDGEAEAEGRLVRPDGTVVWVRASAAISARDEQGRPLRAVSVVQDITGRRKAEEERQRVTGLLSAFTTAVPGVVYAKDRQGRMLVANQGTAALAGKPLAEIIGRTDREFLDNEEQARALMATDQRIMESGAAEQVEEVIRLPSGTSAVWLSTKEPFRNDDGEIIGLVGSSIDISDRKRAEEARELLMREVDHRAKNALAVALSFVRLTPKADPVAYAAAVEGRIAAMARAHSLLADEKWDGVALRTVAETELAPYPGRVHIDGPEVRLAPEAVQPVAMILHELATNAVKHGSLAASGAVALSWEFGRADGRLRLHWMESGGLQIVAPPARRGFGSRLLTSLAERQLGGKLVYDWRKEGLQVSVELPMECADPPLLRWPP